MGASCSSNKKSDKVTYINRVGISKNNKET